MFEWTDPDDGILYELNYVVTQHEDEGPEYVEWRISPRMAGSLKKHAESMHGDGWHRLPPWAMPPEEAMEHWHGKVIRSHAEGVILIMKEGPLSVNTDDDALCITEDGKLFWADLTVFTNLSEPDGDYVCAGMKIRTAHPLFVSNDDPRLRDWLQI